LGNIKKNHLVSLTFFLSKAAVVVKVLDEVFGAIVVVQGLEDAEISSEVLKAVGRRPGTRDQ
jgi:hypothetical protein